MSQQGDRKSDILLDNVAKAKRQQVTAACASCRRKKVKCDGKRPCGDCSRRVVQCEYAASEGETPQQALKRKFDDLSQLYNGLATSSEDQAIETLRRIRAGHQVDSILRHVYRENEPVLQKHRRLFLVALAQSTAALDDIVRLASSILLNANAGVSLPSTPRYEPLKDTIITIDNLYSILTDGPSHGLSHRIADGSHDGPLFWVPANPWTTLTENDEAVSHLISLYLCNMNPFWRFIEEDAFLRAMRSRKSSPYCSSLLVHAILAWASLYSEIDEAFATPGKMLTRGEHFHREAVRLLQLEDQKASITNIQAMLILGLESAKRGKDKLGLDLVYQAAALIKYIPPSESRSDPVADRLASRVRSCLVSSVVWLNFALIQALHRDADAISIQVQDGIIDVAQLLPDTTAYWTGFPLTRDPVPFKMNLLLQERTRLVPIIADIVRPCRDPTSKREILDASSATAWRLHEWHEALPKEVAYSKDMPVPLYELHSHFVDLNMGLYNRALKRLAGVESNDNELAGYEDKLHARSLTWAHRSATIARDFRETYGFKIVAPHVMNMAAVASLILLRLMKEPLLVTSKSPSSSGGRTSNTEIREMGESFAECFRCLLGAGLQEMHARGVARMVYCTALELGVTLPESVQQMNTLVAESAWQPSDLNQLSSTYPNWATVDGSENNMEDMLRKWEDLAIQDPASLANAQANLASAS